MGVANFVENLKNPVQGMEVTKFCSYILRCLVFNRNISSSWKRKCGRIMLFLWIHLQIAKICSPNPFVHFLACGNFNRITINKMGSLSVVYIHSMFLELLWTWIIPNIILWCCCCEKVKNSLYAFGFRAIFFFSSWNLSIF